MNILADLLLEVVSFDETVADWRTIEDEVTDAEKSAMLPDEVKVSQVEEQDGYMMDREGRIYDVDRSATSHQEYCQEFMGMELADALSQGWLRVVVSAQDEHMVYWMGPRITNAQKKTLKDIAAFTGFELLRDTESMYV